jgi:Domain of unknown function (DUF5134)
MAPPPWVAGVLAAVLLLIAGYCASRLAMARWRRRSTDHAVDVMHAVMGVVMAGMLVRWLNPLQSRAWAVLFAAGAVWFGRQVLRERRRRAAPRGPAAVAHLLDGHHGAHVLSCAAMVCMLLAAPGLGAPATAGRGAVPVLALLLAVAVAVSVVVSTDRISALRPASAAPAQAAVLEPTPAQAAVLEPAPAQAEALGPVPARAAALRPGPAPGCACPALSPRLAACCQILMGVAMAYMLILML